jgi:L-threonylcarbamoyladenylate synthase
MEKLRKFTCTKESLSECATVIKRGGVVVFPTDTVYGIGCDPYNSKAVERVFKIKKRDYNKPLPVLVRDQAEAEKLVVLGERGRQLATKYWPGPLTIVAPLLDLTIPSKVTAGMAKLGVRVPSNACLLALLEECRCLVGTSANLSEQTPSQSADEVLLSGIDGYDILIDGGPTESGKESTIVDITDFTIIREGAISEAEIFRGS